MKARLAPLLTVLGLLLSGCRGSSPICAPRTGADREMPDPAPTALPIDRPHPTGSPIPMEIGGRTVNVDQLVTGPLCDGVWSGTVYVACDVQVPAWEGSPTFLEGCDLSVAPDTVVYVAYHNDAPYYNGCSCHTGETSQP